MKKISVEELKETLKKHRLWRRGEPGGKRADLSLTDLHGMDLTRADLSHADLSQSNLSRTRLTRANLFQSNLTGVDFSGANLTRAKLSRAKLSHAKLSHANLSHAHLFQSNLTDVDFSDANLFRADLFQSDLTDACLIGANLSRVNIRGVIGNGKEIKSYQGLEWSVVWTKDQLAVGCAQHSIEEWKNFTDEEIGKMGKENEDTLTFWRKHRNFIFEMVEVSDAK